MTPWRFHLDNAPTTLEAAEFVALTTYRRDGTVISTPIWITACDGQLFLWTAARSGKVRRLWHDRHVRVAPSDFHGRALGPAVPGVATILERSELGRVRRATVTKYGWRFRRFGAIIRLVHLTRLARVVATERVRGAAGGPVAIEITLTDEGGDPRQPTVPPTD